MVDDMEDTRNKLACTSSSDVGLEDHVLHVGDPGVGAADLI